MKNNIFFKYPMATGAVILLIFLAASSWSIMALIKHERQRDYGNWHLTLGIMADSRANNANRWVEEQFTALNNLSMNASLQLYTQQLLKEDTAAQDYEPAQISYLRNLLYSTAEKNGFIDNKQDNNPIQANISFQADNGLALISSGQKVISATPGVGKADSQLNQAILKVLADGKPTLIDIHLNRNNTPVIGFIVPVYGLQVQSGDQEAIAVIYGFKNAASTLFPLFKSDTSTTLTDETILVRRDQESITYITPLEDGTAPLKRQFSANDLNLASAYAVAHPGSFNELRDYAGNKVLFTSRSFTGLPWVLVHKINVDEALNESNTHQQFLLIALFMAALLVITLLVAAWWYGSSLRKQKTADELYAKSQELLAKNHLLDAINDNISDVIFLSDKENRLIFTNSALSQHLKIKAEELKDKTLASVFGPDTASSISPFIKIALDSDQSATHPLSLEISGKIYMLHATFSPIPYFGSSSDAVLVTLHDVTELQEAQKKQASLMKQLIKAMMRAIDLHDPYSANHSAKTTDIAIAIGQAMSFNHDILVALETAANLCNIGKLFIPKEILTKSGRLTDQELEILKKETIYAQNILEGIDFEGAVLQTIAQKHEFLDGTGYPHNLTAETIIPTARILSVANSFIAMISPRAYRDGLTVETALELLMKDAGKRYDRKVIAALFHVAENEIDWSQWHLGE